MALIVHIDRYKPSFNEETGTYYDESMTDQEYTEKYPTGVKCCTGYNFLTYKRHFLPHTRTKVHQMFLKSLKPERTQMNDVQKILKEKSIIIKEYSDQIFHLRTLLSKQESEYFYIIHEPSRPGIYKIGITTRNMLQRLSEYDKDAQICLLYSMANSTQFENDVKYLFGKKFELVGGTEYFKGDLSEMIKIVCTLKQS